MRIYTYLLAGLIYAVCTVSLNAAGIRLGGLPTMILVAVSLGAAAILLPGKKKDHPVDVSKKPTPAPPPREDPSREDPPREKLPREELPREELPQAPGFVPLDSITLPPVPQPRRLDAARLRAVLPTALALVFFLSTVVLSVCLGVSVSRNARLRSDLSAAYDEYSVGYADAEAKLTAQHQADLDALEAEHRQALHDYYYDGYYRGFDHGHEDGLQDGFCDAAEYYSIPSGASDYFLYKYLGD